MKKLLLFVAITCIGSVQACPFTITNDLETPIFITNASGRQAIHIMPGSSQVIDPTIKGWWQKWVKKEKLDFYVLGKTPGTYFHKYQMTESYCTDDEAANKIMMSQIVGFVQSPTDRLSTQDLGEEPQRHEHKDHAH